MRSKLFLLIALFIFAAPAQAACEGFTNSMSALEAAVGIQPQPQQTAQVQRLEIPQIQQQNLSQRYTTTAAPKARFGYRPVTLTAPVVNRAKTYR